MTNEALLITGMPYAGASIVAEACADAGVALRPDPGNGPEVLWRYGNFADPAVVELHRQILRSRTASAYDVPASPPPPTPADLVARAQELVAVRHRGGAPWGWCEPRSCLCLDLWERALPEARWLFIVRDPAVNAFSLVTHSEVIGWTSGPLSRARSALRLWKAYNRRILDFVQRHPDRCLVFDVGRHLNAGGERVLDHRVRHDWGLAVRPLALMAAYRRPRLRMDAPRWLKVLAAADPEVRRIAAGLARFGPTPATASRVDADEERQNALSVRPTVCLAVSRKFGISETFIGAHLERLPADVTVVQLGLPSYSDVHERPILSLPERAGLAVATEFSYNPSWLQSRALSRFFGKHRVDVVLAEFGYNGVKVLQACRTAGIPLVVHFHGADVFRSDLLAANREGYQEIFKYAAALVVVSDEMRQQLLTLKAPAERIVCNPCGVDASVFQGANPAAAPPLFLAIGRFVDKKGPHLTLVAFSRVAAAVPEARLLMAGQGVLLDVCHSLATALGIADKVTFLGAVTHREVGALMRTARAYVQHSIRPLSQDSEGTPVTVLEASASGLPVIATAHAGIRDSVLHGETGFLIDEGDVAAMADAMITLARDAELAANLGRRGRTHVTASFSMERSHSVLWDVLRRAIESHRVDDRRVAAVAVPDRLGQ
jgi:glycosyltransferase involved in cell wall biosynthesis